MKFRRRSYWAIAVLLCLGQPALPQVNGTEVSGGATAQVLSGKSPVVKVSDAEGNELASIPIDKDPGTFLYSKSTNTLYVAHNESKGAHFISAVNLTTSRVDKQISIGAGDEVNLVLSNNGNRLFCYTASKYGSGSQLGGIAAYPEGFLKPPFQPLVTVIDVASNKVLATYDWLADFSSDLHGNWFFTNQILGTGDDGRLIVRSVAFTRMGKLLKDRIIILSGQSSRPVDTLNSAGRVVASLFSNDESHLFLAVDGEKGTVGSLAVLDLSKGTLATHALTTQPTKLFRLGSKQEPWILGGDEMQSISETGELEDRRIPLNKPRKGDEGNEGGGSVFLDGLPGETISLGEEYAAIQITNRNGGSLHKVALIDMKNLQVDAVIPTMGEGEMAGIRTKRIFLTAALSAATLGNVIFIPNMSFRNESLAARPDGRFLFVLDLEGHEVTVVDAKAATVVRRISVNNSVTKLQVSADGKHVICFGNKTQQINLETNNLEN